MEKDELWDLQYWIGKQHTETLLHGKPKALCYWMINQKVAAGSHTRKNFKLKRHETKPIVRPPHAMHVRNDVLR